MKKNDTYSLILCAVFAALTAVLSWISVPIGPVPINLALLAVLLCGAVLGPVRALISVTVYILLGAVGVPVFAGFRAGIGALLGPTGGYIIGYLPAAFLASLRLPGKTARPVLFRCLFMLLGVLSCYLIGTLWFMHLSGYDAGKALSLCVLPFIPGDAVKIAAASLLTGRLQKIIRRKQS